MSKKCQLFFQILDFQSPKEAIPCLLTPILLRNSPPWYYFSFTHSFILFLPGGSDENNNLTDVIYGDREETADAEYSVGKNKNLINRNLFWFSCFSLQIAKSTLRVNERRNLFLCGRKGFVFQSLRSRLTLESAESVVWRKFTPDWRGRGRERDIPGWWRSGARHNPGVWGLW